MTSFCLANAILETVETSNIPFDLEEVYGRYKITEMTFQIESVILLVAAKQCSIFFTMIVVK